MKQFVLMFALIFSFGFLDPVLAQDAAPAAATADGSLELSADAQQAASEESGDNPMGFMNIVLSSGFIGVVLWLGLGACSCAGFALIIDSFVTIREKKIVPEALVTRVKEAVQEGDVLKALKYCEESPGPVSNILSAGFANVQEGYEAIQEAVGVAADLETEKLMQRVTYLNVVANLAPMLGLLGTVQGMIFAFAVLGTQSAGAAQQSMLAINIAQALYTTAAGLLAAVPALAFYFYFRNRTTNIMLGIEALTLDMIKVFRNVEVVSE